MIFFTLVVRMSNSKFGCFLFFSCSFPNKTFANVLFSVRAAYLDSSISSIIQRYLFVFFAKINKPSLPNKPPPLKVISTNKPPGDYSIIYGIHGKFTITVKKG